MPIIAYALTPIRWQKRANYIGTRPQQLRRTDEVLLQLNAAVDKPHTHSRNVLDGKFLL